MEQSTFLAQAIDLTLFGMGFVFMFLALLVVVTKLMSSILEKIRYTTKQNSSLEEELDEETRFIIEQAIKIHRGV